MSVKAILVLCAQALLIESALSYCARPSGVNYGAGLAGCGLAAPVLAAPAAACGAGLGIGAGLGYGAGAGCGGLAIEVSNPTSGGALPVSSASALAPSGLSVASENVFEGALSVAGELPFVSAVALEGVLPSAGAGAVSYSCGNGVTAIQSVGPSAAAIAPSAAAYAPGIAALSPAAAALAPSQGYGGLIGSGCGCSLY